MTTLADLNNTLKIIVDEESKLALLDGEDSEVDAAVRLAKLSVLFAIKTIVDKESTFTKGVK